MLSDDSSFVGKKTSNLSMKFLALDSSVKLTDTNLVRINNVINSQLGAHPVRFITKGRAVEMVDFSLLSVWYSSSLQATTIEA